MLFSLVPMQGDGSMTRESLLFDVDTAIRVRTYFSSCPVAVQWLFACAPRHSCPFEAATCQAAETSRLR